MLGAAKRVPVFLTIRPDILLLFEFRTERAEYITQRLVPALQLFFNDFLLLLRFFLLPHYRRRLGTPRPRRAFFLTRARARERYDFSNFFFLFLFFEEKIFPRDFYDFMLRILFFSLSSKLALCTRASSAFVHMYKKEFSKKEEKLIFMTDMCVKRNK